MEVVILRNDRSLLAEKYGQFSEGRANNYQDILDVKKALDRLRITYKEVVVKEDLSNLNEVKKLKPDMVVNLLDDFMEPKKEALASKKLKTMGVLYTGDAYEPLVMCTQKALAKKKLMNFGVMTPKYQLITSATEKIKGLKYPLIIKPNTEHGSIGITQDSIVHNDEQLQKKLNEILQQYGQTLVEEYIEGKEISTVVIGDKVMRVSEIVFDDEKFQGKQNIMTYDAKWDGGTEEFTGTARQAAKLPKQLEEKIIEESKKAYKALGCKSYARIDLRLDEKGTPYVLEVNVNPDLSREGAVAKIAGYSRISYVQLIRMIIDNAVQTEQDIGTIKMQEQKLEQFEERKAA